MIYLVYAKAIEIELDYQNKKMSEDDVHDEIDKLYKELETSGGTMVIR